MIHIKLRRQSALITNRANPKDTLYQHRLGAREFAVRVMTCRVRLSCVSYGISPHEH